MLFIENNKKLSFQITGYQFFEDAAELDAEWLNCKIEYCENGIEKTFVEPCLLIGELDELVSALSNILEGNATSFISEFIEPFLKIAFASVEKKNYIYP